MQKRKIHTKEFKLEAVRLLERGDKTAADLARELNVRRNQLYKWNEQLAGRGESAFPGHGRRTGREVEVARLKRELVRVTEERDILKKAAVGSTGQCNTIYFNLDLESGVYGTNGATRTVCFPEGGAVAKVEKWAVVKRYRSGSSGSG